MLTILRTGPYAEWSRFNQGALKLYSKEEGTERDKKSVNVANTHWPDADWRSVFSSDYSDQITGEITEVNSGYVGLNGALGSKEGLPTVFTVDWPSVGGKENPFLGGGFFYQATEAFNLKLKYKYWNGYSSIKIRIQGQLIESKREFLDHTIAPSFPSPAPSFPGPSIDDEYSFTCPATALGQLSISMDAFGESLDGVSGTQWVLEFVTD